MGAPARYAQLSQRDTPNRHAHGNATDDLIKDIDFWRSWHGLVAKRSFAYDDGLRIPWIVRMPGYVPVKLRLLHQLAQAEMEREATRQPRVSGS